MTVTRVQERVPFPEVSGRYRAAIAVVAFAYALVYLLPLRAYGLNVEDEGTLLYQITRAVRGELPYVDFGTGYTPGFFALNATAWWATGDLVTFRTLIAVVHAGSVAGLAALLAGVARPWIALLLPALYLAFIPVYPGQFCAFNIAYPAWFATAGWIATAGAVVAFVRHCRRRWVVAAGVAAAVTLAMKPNAGVFAFAAAASSILMIDSAAGPRGGRIVAGVWFVVFVAILLGVLVVFGVVPRPLDALVYLVPLTLGMAALVTSSRMRRARTFGDLVALSVPFLALSVPWLAFFWWRLGTAGFLREVLLIGSGAADIFYIPFPRPEPWGLLLTALAAGYALAAPLAMRWVMPRAMVAAILAAVVAAVVAVSRLGVMPEGLLWSMIWQLQSGAFTLTLLAHAGGVYWIWRRRADAASAPPSARADLIAAVLLVFGMFMFLQLYPRADFMHLLNAAPLTLVFAGFLLERVLVAWEEVLGAAHRGALRAVSAGAGAAVAAAMAVGLTPAVQALTAGPRFVLPFEVAPIGVETARADDLRALAGSGELLARKIEDAGPAIGFPGISVLLFLTGGVNPTPYDYFFAGRPDHREEAETLDLLVATRPAALAALNRQFTFFDAASSYYFLLRRFVREHYALAARSGRFDVLAASAGAAPVPEPETPPDAPPRDEVLARAASDADLASRLAALGVTASYPPDATATTLLTAAGDSDALVRRAAVDSLLTAIARAPERGLEAYVSAHGSDRRARILLLRTIRDLRDPRAASYLFAEAASGDARVARDALGAMKVTRAQMVARLRLWAGPEEPRVWPGRAGLVAAVRATLADLDAPAEATAFAAELAGLLGDRDAVDALRRRVLDGTPSAQAAVPLADAATAASAAASLVRLVPEADLACTLTRLLARPDAPIAEIVPSALVDLAESNASLRPRIVDCLRTAIASGVESAIWVVAVLGEASLTPELRIALANGTPEVRRASAWTLGELADAPAVAPALRAAAGGDPDDVVRRLADRAHAKLTGAVARSLRAPERVGAFSDRGRAG